MVYSTGVLFINTKTEENIFNNTITVNIIESFLSSSPDMQVLVIFMGP